MNGSGFVVRKEGESQLGPGRPDGGNRGRCVSRGAACGGGGCLRPEKWRTCAIFRAQRGRGGCELTDAVVGG